MCSVTIGPSEKDGDPKFILSPQIFLNYLYVILEVSGSHSTPVAVEYDLIIRENAHMYLSWDSKEFDTDSFMSTMQKDKLDIAVSNAAKQSKESTQYAKNAKITNSGECTYWNRFGNCKKGMSCDFAHVPWYRKERNEQPSPVTPTPNVYYDAWRENRTTGKEKGGKGKGKGKGAGQRPY